MKTSKLVSRILLATVVSSGTARLDEVTAGESGVPRAASPAVLRPADAGPLRQVPPDAAAEAGRVFLPELGGERPIHRTQYQPGSQPGQVVRRPAQQAAPQPVQPPAGGTAARSSSSVQAELQRLFRENGQQMPSMRQQDLPYATTPQTHMIRPSQPKKRNLLERFIGRLRGDSPPPESAQSEPVPAAPAPPPYTAHTQRPVPQQPAVRQPQAALQTRTAQPQRPRPAAIPADPRARSLSQSPRHEAAPVVVRPVRPQPTAAAAVPQAPRSQQTAGGNSPRDAVNPRAFVQPGSAPAFMPNSATARPPRTSDRAVSLQRPAGEAATPIAPQSSPSADAGRAAVSAEPAVADEFINPFEEPAVDAGSDAILDLDALIEDPVTTPDDSQPVSATPAPTPADSPRNAAEPSADAPPAVPAPSPNAPEDLVADDVTSSEDAFASPQPSPFTGVRLDLPEDEQAFETETTAGRPSPQAEHSESDDLPELPLPSVDDGEAVVSDESPDTPADFTDQRETRKTLPQVSPQHRPQPTPPQDAQSTRQQQRAKIASRPDLPGFKGFCPVALRDDRTLVDADSSVTATFGLQQFSLSSDEARQRFEADPARYVPAAGGSDVVLLVNAGEEQPGSLANAVWFRDRLYMFRSRETLSLFVSDPLRYADQY